MVKRLKIAALICLLVVGFFSSAFAAKKTDLTMYYPVAVGGPIPKIINSMVADFEKENPDIRIHAIYAGDYTDAKIKALAALKSGEPPQLAVLLSVNLYDLIEQNAIIPISNIAKSKKDRKWLNSFFPVLMENATVFGKVWSVPFQRSTILMYYNKNAFRKAGLDPGNPPQTWSELVAEGKKLTTKNQWGLMIPSSGYPYWLFQALAKENGEVLMSKDGKKTFFDKNGVIEALQFWYDLSHRYKIMPKGIIDWGTLRQNFLDGKTAIMLTSSGNLTPVRKNAKFDFGVAMLPAKKMRGTPTGGGNFYIFRKTSKKQREAALKFIKFMTSPEMSAVWSVKTGYIGTSEKAYQTKELRDYIKKFPYAKIAKNQLKYATAELSTYQGARIVRDLNNAIQAALIGKKTSKKALSDAQSESERILKPYR
ncbi:MAG: ABC transporter substrate-binding protein [Epsilonproteobacteria bacterium]|nr:ABC transporter substrate-binding protein [Campylobacterota bacterium]